MKGRTPALLSYRDKLPEYKLPAQPHLDTAANREEGGGKGKKGQSKND